jgi:hypothetical protein
MYSQGQLVQNTVDGSRPGYDGDTSKVYNKKTGHIYPGGNAHSNWWSKNPGKNQHGAKLNEADKQAVKKLIKENPEKYFNQKETIKFLGKKRAILVPADEYPKPGKVWSNEAEKLRNEADKAWTKKYSNISIEDKTRGDMNIHRQHAGGLREPVGTENTMFLESKKNTTEIRPFEKAIDEIQLKQYRNNLNRNLSTSKKKLVFEALEKEEAALRAANPEFSKYKSSLIFKESSLSKTGFMKKEVMSDPELTISEGKTGQKFKYKNVKPASEEGKKIIELSTKNFLAKRQKVMDVGKANAAFKTMKQGGQKVSDEVILICKTNVKSMGGRIGYKLGSGGCPFAEANPRGFLEAVKNNKVLKSFLKTPKALNIARTVARASNMTLNPLSWIGGEAWFVGLEAMNSASKGIPGDEALDDAFFFYDFKKVDENILKTAEKMGLDKNQIQLIKSNMAINRNMSELGKRQKLLERAGSDIADISEIDTGVVNQEIDKINSDLRSNIHMYVTKTSQITGKNRDELADSDYGIGLNLTNKTFSQKVLAERQSEFKNIRTRADELAGGMGNWLNTNIFNTDVWTQPLKYAADVIDPRTKGVPFKTKEQQEQAYLNKIGKEYLIEPSTVISDVGTEEYTAGKKNPDYNPRELYLYNRSRNLTRDNPNMEEALPLRRSYQPALGTSMFNLDEKGGYNLLGAKDGGRAGYAEGGLAGLMKKYYD